jgi:predicted membrane chloride channel (bestrophin family)
VFDPLINFTGIEELAVQLEEPFSILPLQAMNDGIGRAVTEFSEWHDDVSVQVYDIDLPYVNGRQILH